MGARPLQLGEVEQQAQKGLSSAVGGPASSLLDSCPVDLWPRLRRLLAASVSKACEASPAWPASSLNGDVCQYDNTVVKAICCGYPKMFRAPHAPRIVMKQRCAGLHGTER